jgi:hypothetical protein
MLHGDGAPDKGKKKRERSKEKKKRKEEKQSKETLKSFEAWRGSRWAIGARVLENQGGSQRPTRH